MGRVSPINVALLLEPIAGANPAGEDLRLDPSPSSLYQSLLSAQSRARKEERTALMQGTAKAEPVPAWTEVFDLAHAALAEKTKDVHIAVFMLEAAVRKFGIFGLKDSITVLRGLIEKYWDPLYPAADEDGSFEKRMSFLRGLDGGDRAGTLIAPIQLVSLIAVNGKPAITLQQFSEEPEGDLVKAAMSAMKPDAATELATTASACREEFTALRDAMVARAGESAPPTRNIEDAIQQVLSATTSIESKVAPNITSQTAAVATSESEPVGETSMDAPVAITGPIKSRTQALAMLDAVALFFQKHDHHSFVAYGAAEVARWGRMPLPELLGEMLQGNDTARDTLSRRLGVMIQEAKKAEG